MVKSQNENNRKSLLKITVTDWIFLLIFVTFFSLIVIDSSTPMIRFFFEPIGPRYSMYSLASVMLIFCYWLIWGGLKITDKIRNITSYRERGRISISRAFKFIGLQKIGQKDQLYILASVFIGFAFNFLTLYGVALLKDGSFYLTVPPSILYLIIQDLFAIPFIEELVFRGVYLNSLLRILGRNYYSIGLGLVLSSFTFGWTHTGDCFSLLAKTAGGFLLGVTLAYPKAPLVLFGIDIGVGIYRACLVNMALFSNHPYSIMCANTLLLDPDKTGPAGKFWDLGNRWQPPDISAFNWKPPPIRKDAFSLAHFTKLKKT